MTRTSWRKVRAAGNSLLRDIDTATAEVKAAEAARQEAARVEFALMAEARSAQRARIEAERFASIRVGDYIDIGGSNPLRVIKVNRVTVKTYGGSAWMAADIRGVQHA